MDGTGFGAREPRRQNARFREPATLPFTDNIVPSDWRHGLKLSRLEWQILARLAIPDQVLRSAARRARAFRLDLITVLIANGVLDRTLWWSRIARELGLAYRPTLPTALLAPPFRDGRLTIPAPHVAMIPAPGGKGYPMQAIAPGGPSLDRLRDLLARHPELAERIVIATPETIAASVRAAAAGEAARLAAEGFHAGAPGLSAKGAPGPWSLFGLFLAAALAFGLSWAVPEFFVLAVCLPASLAFVMVGAVRMAAGLMQDRRPPPMLRFGRAPRYLVLVPLHDEAAVVGDLIRALARLKYPRERLTIVLIMEADDRATIAEVAGRRLPAHFRTVIVPDGRPRTKPRALNHALSLFASDLVTVYDAEDRPHPLQLIEAAQAFAKGERRLACLQSPLVIDTVGPGSTWISRQFALEYDSLFRRVLPILATLGVPLPLGGTSMHLKRVVLDQVGRWDPYNVTEDADLGMRLARFGYRTDCLTLPTYEEAPITARAWIGQRSRWLKGWMVTWFVHMRSPVALWREAGLLGFLALNLIVFGAAIAALAYPISVGVLLLGVAGIIPLFADRSLWGDVWLVTFLIAFFGGVGASLWLTAVSALRTRAAPLSELWLTLAYWFLLAFAMARAVKGLIHKPSHWQKTAHGQAKRRPLALYPKSRAGPRRGPLRGPGSPR